MFTKEEKIRRLKSLSRLEMDVLFYFGQGKTDDEICEILGGITQKTLETRRTGIYKVLVGVDVPDREKQNYLAQKYSPLIPIVCPNEEALKHWRPMKLEENGNSPKEVKTPLEEKPKEPINFRILIFAFFVVVVVAGAYLVGQMGSRSPSQLPPLPTYNLPPTLKATQLTVVILTNTAIPSFTFTPTITIIPTETKISPTDTPIPSPTPVIKLPFTDDFSKGINPPWQIDSGKWFVSDSGATITISDQNNNNGAIYIDDPTLTNYRLKVDVYSPNVLSANQGGLGVIVRYRSDHDQNLIFFMNSASRFQWAYTPSLSVLPFNLPLITGVVKANISSRFTMEIDVSGNTFTAKVDGVKYDQFTMTGYENGGIALVTACGNVGSCPSFSNFSLVPLP